jgi:hypothetical protein
MAGSRSTKLRRSVEAYELVVCIEGGLCAGDVAVGDDGRLPRFLKIWPAAWLRSPSSDVVCRLMRPSAVGTRVPIRVPRRRSSACRSLDRYNTVSSRTSSVAGYLTLIVGAGLSVKLI